MTKSRHPTGAFRVSHCGSASRPLTLVAMNTSFLVVVKVYCARSCVKLHQYLKLEKETCKRNLSEYLIQVSRVSSALARLRCYYKSTFSLIRIQASCKLQVIITGRIGADSMGAMGAIAPTAKKLLCHFLRQ